MAETRSSTEHEVFGQYLEKIPEDQLPKKIEIVCHFLYRKNYEFDQTYNRGGKVIKTFKPKTKSTVIKEISSKVSDVWSKASIPIKSSRAVEISVEKLIDDALEKYSKDLSYYKTTKNENSNWKSDFVGDR